MATSIPSPASSSSSSSSSAATFNGSSTFASDLQNSITRSVKFATLPLTLLQNKQNDLNSHQTALSDLSGQFQALQTALDAVNKAATTQSNAVTVGSQAVASATVTSAADAANYAISVTNIGSSTNALSGDSLPKVTNPDFANIDPSHAFTLTVDHVNYQISDSAGSLTGLKDAINASSANVSATIINVGNNTTPDYRLSVQSAKFAPTAISLSNSTSTSLLNTLSTGASVQYAINGQSSTISSDTRSVNLAPGLTVNLQQPGTTSITVAHSAATLSTALSAFATAYNTSFDGLAKSRGTTTSALAGDPIIYAATQSLQNLRNSSTTTNSTVNSLEALGFSFGKDGHLTFDSSVLSGASSATLSDASKFLGSETSGGFLQSASSTLSALNDSTNGLFILGSKATTNQLTALGTKIADTQTRITALQTALTAQMDKADAAIASLQQTAAYFTNLYQTTNSNNTAGV